MTAIQIMIAEDAVLAVIRRKNGKVLQPRQDQGGTSAEDHSLKFNSVRFIPT